jgi:hypothetical protein
MVFQGPRETILAGFATLALTGDQVMQDAIKEWKIMADGEPEGADGAIIPMAVAILGQGGVNWKWYPDYPCVAAHRRIWRHFADLHENEDDTQKLVDGSFVRVGEEDGDIETESIKAAS